ncbi:hypothetical protein [uncultured Bacteroides sp.]|uniref:hypothetical protein n=1 Tax=uncultured Bacteroides sp. TaxID=162156 RepID=UPI0025928386|nr:hypothetical protein [uncultured Bacteroides sp.]
MKTIIYLPVNWVNGLKLTSQHFFANHYCLMETLNREAGRNLTSYNYGLGEELEGIGSNLEIDISGDTMSNLCVRLKSCNAITKGGLPIIYYEGLYGDQKPSASISESDMQAEDSEYMVLVSVDPYHSVPVGEPDPDEVPLHHPYVLPNIKLHIIPKSQVNKSFYSQNFLLLAEVCRYGNTYKINHQYIPPVQRSAYYDGIKTFISQLSRTLRNIKEDVKLIYSRNVADKRRDTLANNTFELCKAFNTFYNSNIFFIEQMAHEEPPINLVQSVNELANGLNATLQSFSETEREELLQYFYEWTNVTPSEFVTKIEKVTGLIYDHTDINQSLQTTGALITLLSRMFHKMSELEYIGMVRENIVVGDETHEEAVTQKKRSWSFIG